MKPIIRQLIVAVIILVLVTVASLGIRKHRFSVHRPKTAKNNLSTEIEPRPHRVDPHTVDPEPETQYAELAEPEEEMSVEDEPESTSLKSKYANAKDKSPRDFEKISLGKNENLYITKDGETWYVGKTPDGTEFKMQVQIDETTGEILAIGRIYGGKSDGSEPVKISMSNGEELYITKEGETWHVAEGSKSRVEIDNTTGEMVVLEQYSDNDDK